MSRRSANLPKLMGTPLWLFPWQGRESPLLPSICAVLLVSLVTAGLFASVQVKVITPAPMVPRKATLIYLADDPQGRALAQRALEGGPFPSRFEPDRWAGMAALENEAFAAFANVRPAYVPKLRELPADDPQTPVIAAPTALAVLPATTFKRKIPVDSTGFVLKPVLFALSGIPQQQLSMALPPFTAVIDRTLTAASWRFLLRLRPNGQVIDCVSLEQADPAASQALEHWLRGVAFPASPEPVERWLALGLGFSNQPSQ